MSIVKGQDNVSNPWSILSLSTKRRVRKRNNDNYDIDTATEKCEILKYLFIFIYDL